MNLYLPPQLLRHSRSALAGLLLGALMHPVAAFADVSKGSDWIGRAVVTEDGQPLGRIEDLALDVEQARIAYWVVSVGSFLIEDSLIAVHPDALGPSAQGEALVLYTDSLADARRFNDDRWPAAADVLPSEAAGSGALVAAAPDVESRSTGFAAGGSATISNGRRQAIFADGERRIEPVRRASSARASVTAEAPSERSADGATRSDGGGYVDPENLKLPSFASLDRDQDGLLSRREIGPRLGLNEPFPSVDVDGSGAVDPFEFDLLREGRE